MKETMKSRIFKRSAWTLLTIFFALLMSIFLIIDPIAQQYYTFVDQFFGVTRTVPVAVETENPNDFQYFTSEYSMKDENGNYLINDRKGIRNQKINQETMRAHSEAIARQVCEEGMVLLWNKDCSDGSKALPLKKGAKISNFGVATKNYVYHGIGSGQVELDENAYLIDVVRALTAENVGFQLNPDCLTSIENAGKRGYGVTLAGTNEMPYSNYSTAAKNAIAEYGDAALVIFSRYYGEGGDINTYYPAAEDGSRLSLTKNERSLLGSLKELKDKGTLKKVILAINVPTPMNLKWVDEYDVDACLWVNWGGSMGVEALADVLVGNAEPSGHTTDTWLYDAFSAPANRNFGDFTYTSMPNEAPATLNKYVVYQEGIYVGYRYFETRYEDVVLGRGNASDPTGSQMSTGGAWSYGAEVAYPFGYGAGYTSFSYSNYKVTKSDSDYIVSVDVTNTGSRAGKDAVQFYLQKPYTDYDIANKIEKSAVELVGFEKTPEIEPGSTVTVTSTIPEYEFKSYDAYGQGTYILEKGDYYLAVGQDSHNAVNNILAAKGKTTADGMDADGNSALAYKINYRNNDYTTYSVSKNGTKIVNRFDYADVNCNEEMDQTVTYLSRNDWAGTYPNGVSLALKGAWNASMSKYEKEIPNNSEDTMPLYETVTSEYGKLMLIQLRGLPYDHPLWDDLLNQLSFDEQETLMRSCASAGLTSIAAPGITQQDGPNGNRSSRFALPSEPILACTFNKELIEELGVVFGTEMFTCNIAGIYGVGCNTHRSAYGGRVNEYYSEDGFLAGTISSYESKGMRSMGVILFTKHFALNDQDTNRGVAVHTWSNEQALREIYLKAFETSIVDGWCNGLMTSFNSIGPVWAGANDSLLNKVCRDEWGFTGITITDACGTNAYMGGESSVHAFANLAGQDAWMGNFAVGALKPYYEAKNATVCNSVRESAHRILYTQLNSLMMNGVSTDTSFIDITPAWETAITAMIAVFATLTGVCLIMTATSWVVWVRDKKSKIKK